MEQPVGVLLNEELGSSIQTLNNNGDKMPTCLTTFVMKKLSDTADPHLTHVLLGGTPFHENPNKK